MKGVALFIAACGSVAALEAHVDSEGKAYTSKQALLQRELSGEVGPGGELKMQQRARAAAHSYIESLAKWAGEEDPDQEDPLPATSTNTSSANDTNSSNTANNTNSSNTTTSTVVATNASNATNATNTTETSNVTAAGLNVSSTSSTTTTTTTTAEEMLLGYVPVGGTIAGHPKKTVYIAAAILISIWVSWGLVMMLSKPGKKGEDGDNQSGGDAPFHGNEGPFSAENAPPPMSPGPDY